MSCHDALEESEINRYAVRDYEHGCLARQRCTNLSSLLTASVQEMNINRNCKIFRRRGEL